MKRNGAKIIQITGFRGIITAIFVVVCLVAGFVVFPGFVAMNIWNHFVSYNVPQLNIYQGVMLWAIVAITYFIFSRQSFLISFAQPKELSDDEMNMLMNKIKLQSQAKIINDMVIKNLEELKKEENHLHEQVFQVKDKMDSEEKETADK